nr:phosphotransferase [Specibacter cremeus]
MWLHGDLHPGNMLCAGGALTAVVDFGDLCRGDPATDLATAWLTFGPSGRAVFRASVDAAGRGDDALWLRAQGWAVNLATAMLAHSDDNPAMYAVGRHAVAQLLGDR